MHSLAPFASSSSTAAAVDRFTPSIRPSPRGFWGTTNQIGVQTGADRVVPAQFGRLAPWLREPHVTDAFVDAGGAFWVDRGSGLEWIRSVELDAAEARALAVSLVALGGRHVDEATPCADVRLADGIRVHVALPPVSTGGALLSIRIPHRKRLGLDDLESSGFFDRVLRTDVVALVESRANLLVTGASGSGKTTLLAALLGAASPRDRIVTLEDVAELRIDHPHVVALQTRQANLEGAGSIDLTRLVREALRMRPDRLVVGECRGAELRELLTALNTGHDGGAGTLHANGLATVASRLEALGALAGLSASALARQAVSAFDAVLHVERLDDRRVLSGIGRFALDATGRLEVVGARE